MEREQALQRPRDGRARLDAFPVKDAVHTPSILTTILLAVAAIACGASPTLTETPTAGPTGEPAPGRDSLVAEPGYCRQSEGVESWYRIETPMNIREG
jgi:hypothetical protein